MVVVGEVQHQHIPVEVNQHSGQVPELAVGVAARAYTEPRMDWQESFEAEDDYSASCSCRGVRIGHQQAGARMEQPACHQGQHQLVLRYGWHMQMPQVRRISPSIVRQVFVQRNM